MVTRVVVAVTSVALLCLVGCTPAGTETPTSPPTATTTTPVPTPTETLTPVETTPTWSAEQQAAVDTVARWFLIYNEVLRGERNPNDLALAARETALADAQRTYNQFGLANLTVQGEVAVTNLDPSKPESGERQSVLVSLCQDTTNWQVLDEDGKDTLKLDAKIVRPLIATVEEWPKDGWFVTSFAQGAQACESSG